MSLLSSSIVWSAVMALIFNVPSLICCPAFFFSFWDLGMIF